MSYLNTKPLVWGFEQGMMKDEIELSFDYPANLASKLASGDLDIALLPVASIPNIKDAAIVSDYCIGASSAVASVCLFSDQPLDAMQTILLDYQSKTSVALLDVLLVKYWGLKEFNIDIEHAGEGYESRINGDTAGLVIGDRAFELRGKYPYVYDLAEEWINYTKLPFVFAAWVANKELPAEFLTAFNLATGRGLHHIEEIVDNENYGKYDLKTYYTKNIDYILDDKKREGMKLFLSLIS